MIRIGFDSDDPELVRRAAEKKKPGVKYNFEKEKTVYIPPARLEMMKQQYTDVVVHEFGDDYHMSEEEKEQKNKYYKAFKKLSCSKKKTRKITEYIDIVRHALYCLDLIANNNAMYSPEKFKRLYFSGKIYIEGLMFPKYIGKDRKQISTEYLSEFILGNQDPSEFIQKNEVYMDDDEIEESVKILFNPGELDRILEDYTESEQEAHRKFFDKDCDEQEDWRVVELSEKANKKFIKDTPEMLEIIKIIRKNASSEEQLNSYGHPLSSDDLEKIRRYDMMHNHQSESDMPVFTGDIMNDDDYNKYMMELVEWEDTNTKVQYEGKWKTPEEVRMLQLKSVLEENGWDIRSMYDNKEKKRQLDKAIRRDKKREARLKKKLMKVQDRKKRRMGDAGKKEKKSEKRKRKEDD